MTDRAALYRSILERPDDDLPRLVYADWLEENGESERAEFIRRQISGEDVRPSIHWFPLPHKWFTFSRGFASSVRCTLADWVGGPCAVCDGTGWERVADAAGDMDEIGCRSCGGMTNTSGTSRTPAHGPRIVAEHPVERVELVEVTDADSCIMDYGDGMPDDARFGVSIPVLSDASLPWPEKLFVTREDAVEYLEDLSDRLLNWARHRAGLSPLPQEAP